MNHRQQMSDKQRHEWDVKQYKAQLAARRGHNHSYLDDEAIKKLEAKGYNRYTFKAEYNGYKTNFEHEAIKVRDGLRAAGCFARIVVNPSYVIRGAQTYSVYWKQKKSTK